MKLKINMGAKELIELGRRRCGPGKILRSGFTRKDGTFVKPACVPDKGAPGKTPASKRILPKPVPGELGRWTKNIPASSRHSALKKVVERRGCKKVIWSLTRLANLTTDPPTKTKARSDARWLHDQNFCRLKTKKK